MLSICIPVYNYEVVVLVTELLRQAQQLQLDFEILVWEDGSTEEHKQANRSLARLHAQVHYVEWEDNRGRSIIRNRLAAAAHYRYLLFMDCDAYLPDDQFLARYQLAWEEEVDKQVICGGRVYPSQPEEASLQLHWRYGTTKESQSAAQRQQWPNRSFMTNNFLISKSIFVELAFNEALKGYGHEDTLFGWDLQKKGIQIKHIENPVVHVGMESAAVFLEKTKEGVANLHRLYNLLGEEERWYAEVSLLKFFLNLKQWHLAKTVFYLLSLCSGPIERQLKTAKPSLVLFDLFKLYHLLQQDQVKSVGS